MKTKSTYSLLLNADAEEKGRSIFETAAYALVVGCMAISGSYFAATNISLPREAGPNKAQRVQESMIAKVPAQQAQSLVAVR